LLKQLQKLDGDARELQRRMEALNARVGEAARRVEAARAKVKTGGETRRAVRAEVDKKELELKSKEVRTQKLTVQLNSVRTNKEYATLEHEIAALKADASLLEDEMLLMLDRIDKDEAERREHEEQLKAAEEELQNLRQQVSQELASTQNQLQCLGSQRDALSGQVNPDLLSLYERLLRNKDGRAVVPTAPTGRDDRICVGCNMRLTSNTASLLMAADGLVRCHSCGRILYIQKEEQQAAG
jgi:hypothetical protein